MYIQEEEVAPGEEEDAEAEEEEPDNGLPSQEGGSDEEAVLEDGLRILAELFYISGDKGGGANCDRMYKYLKRNGAMPEDGIVANCLFHALNLALARSCEDILGKQGIGHDSPFQMLFLFPLIIKKVTEDGGRDTFTDYWGKSIKKLLTDKAWTEDAKRRFPQAMHEFAENIEEMTMKECKWAVCSCVALH